MRIPAGEPARWGGVPVTTVLAVALTLAFALIASRNISQPGLYPDEVRHVLPALAFVEGDLSSNAVPGTGPELSLGDHKLSAMVAPYVGQVKTIAVSPVVALTDISAASVRYFAIAVAALALLAMYAFARRLFRDQAIALVGLALLVVDPGFIFFARHDFDSTVYMLLAMGMGGWQLLRWWDTGRTLSLVLGMIALGLGLYDKFTFVWVLLALTGATALVAGRTVLKRLDWRTALIGAGAFVAGSLPLIVYNLRSNFGTLNRYERFTDEYAGGGLAFPYDERVVPEGWFGSQFAQRLRVLGDLLDGSTASRMIGSPFPNHFEVVPALVAVAALAICIQLVLRRPLPHEVRAGAFALVVTALVLAVAALTEPGFHGHHVLLAYPFPQLMLALGLVQTARLLARAVPLSGARARFASSLVVLAAIPVAFSAVTVAGMFDTFAQTGGRGVWSDGIYELERHVTREYPQRPMLSADWGLAPQLLTLSQGRIRIDEVAYDIEHQARSAPLHELISERVRDQRTLYLLRSPEATVMRVARRRFFAAIADMKRRPVRIATLDDREGRPLHEIYSLKPAAAGR